MFYRKQAFDVRCWLAVTYLLACHMGLPKARVQVFAGFPWPWILCLLSDSPNTFIAHLPLLLPPCLSSGLGFLSSLWELNSHQDFKNCNGVEHLGSCLSLISGGSQGCTEVCGSPEFMWTNWAEPVVFGNGGKAVSVIIKTHIGRQA